LTRYIDRIFGLVLMPAATLEERVTSLERRMSDLEGQVGFLLPLVRQIHLDLLGFKEEVDEQFQAMDAKIDRLEGKMEGRFNQLESRVDARFNQLESRVDAMPRAVAETVVEMLKKQR